MAGRRGDRQAAWLATRSGLGVARPHRPARRREIARSKPATHRLPLVCNRPRWSPDAGCTQARTTGDGPLGDALLLAGRLKDRQHGGCGLARPADAYVPSASHFGLRCVPFASHRPSNSPDTRSANDHIYRFFAAQHDFLRNLNQGQAAGSKEQTTDTTKVLQNRGLLSRTTRPLQTKPYRGDRFRSAWECGFSAVCNGFATVIPG